MGFTLYGLVINYIIIKGFTMGFMTGKPVPIQIKCLSSHEESLFPENSTTILLQIKISRIGYLHG